MLVNPCSTGITLFLTTPPAQQILLGCACLQAAVMLLLGPCGHYLPLCLQVQALFHFHEHCVCASSRLLTSLSPRRQVLSVYHGRQWAFIEEHLYDTLGKSSRDSGDLLTAVQHFMHMLPCPQSSPHWQGVYLQQLLDAVQQASHKQVGQVPAC